MPLDRADILAALQAKGFELEQKNRDPDFLFFRHKGLTSAVLTKVSRGSRYRTIDDRLVSKMGKQAKLTKREFESLVRCSLTEQGFIAALSRQGVLTT